MKLIILAHFALLAIVTSATAADYEVTIDGRMYLFSQGVKQDILLKDGKRISINIEGVKTRTFQEHGISFDYPSDMTISQESFYGITEINLESTDLTWLMIQLVPAGTTPAELQRDLLATFRKKYGNLGARFPAQPTAPCRRSIGGIERQGVTLSYALGAPAFKTEIYTFQKDGKTLATVFQYAEEEKEKATRRYDVVSKSFK